VSFILPNVHMAYRILDKVERQYQQLLDLCIQNLEVNHINRRVVAEYDLRIQKIKTYNIYKRVAAEYGLCPCVATVLACSSGAVSVTGPPTLCGCSRQHDGPTYGWPGATRSRSGPLRCRCRPNDAELPSRPCVGALAAPWRCL
jgi:hypothetical protein